MARSKFRPHCESLESRHLMAGDISFQDVSATSGIAPESHYLFDTAWLDFNGDGWQDIWLGSHGPGSATERPPPRLYKNLGNGQFVDVFSQLFPDELKNDLHGALWTDLDNDGDLDLVQTVGGGRGYTTNTSYSANRIYVQDAGRMKLVSYVSGLDEAIARGREVEALDANRDGLVDIALANATRYDGLSPSNLHLQGSSGFRASLSPATSPLVKDDSLFALSNDVTGDGVADLVIANAAAEVRIFTTGTNGQLTERTDLLPTLDTSLPIRDIAIADFNGDTYNDMFIMRREAAQAKGELLLYRPAQGKFSLATTGLTSSNTPKADSIVAADFDNDGDIDIYASVEYNGFNYPDKFLRNRGNGVFDVLAGESSTSAMAIDHGVGKKVAAGDFNNDGFLDLLINSTSATDSQSQLLQNSGNGNHWLQIKLEGVNSNREALGARVLVTVAGKKQAQLKTTGKHVFTQDASSLHFGVGSNTVVDQVFVRWPSGRVSQFNNVPVDQVLTIAESKGEKIADARPISLALAGGNYKGNLVATDAVDYYRFALPGSGTLNVTLSGATVAARLEDASGALIQRLDVPLGSRTLTRDLPAGTYHLRISRNNNAAARPYELTPRFTLNDTIGPEVRELTLDDTLDPTRRAVVALLSDGRTGNGTLAGGEFFIDTVGPANSGTPLQAYDGSFDFVSEYSVGYLDPTTYAGLADGPHTIYVRGRDAAGNWGGVASYSFVKTTSVDPQLALNATAAVYTGTPVTLAALADVVDTDTTDFSQAVLTVGVSQSYSGDRFDLAYDSVIKQNTKTFGENRVFSGGREIARYWGGWPVEAQSPYTVYPLKIFFTASATLTDVREVLRRLQYWNDSGNGVGAADRTLSFLFVDGQGGRTSGSLTLR